MTGSEAVTGRRLILRAEVQLLGRTVHFFTTEDVVDDAPYVLSTIRAALARAA